MESGAATPETIVPPSGTSWSRETAALINPYKELLQKSSKLTTTPNGVSGMRLFQDLPIGLQRIIFEDFISDPINVGREIDSYIHDNREDIYDLEEDEFDDYEGDPDITPEIMHQFAIRHWNAVRTPQAQERSKTWCTMIQELGARLIYQPRVHTNRYRVLSSIIEADEDYEMDADSAQGQKSENANMGENEVGESENPQSAPQNSKSSQILELEALKNRYNVTKKGTAIHPRPPPHLYTAKEVITRVKLDLDVPLGAPGLHMKNCSPLDYALSTPSNPSIKLSPNNDMEMSPLDPIHLFGPAAGPGADSSSSQSTPVGQTTEADKPESSTVGKNLVKRLFNDRDDAEAEPEEDSDEDRRMPMIPKSRVIRVTRDSLPLSLQELESGIYTGTAADLPSEEDMQRMKVKHQVRIETARDRLSSKIKNLQEARQKGGQYRGMRTERPTELVQAARRARGAQRMTQAEHDANPGVATNTNKLLLYAPPPQISNTDKKFTASPYGNMVKLGFRKADGGVEVSNCLLDSGNSVGEHCCDNVIMSEGFANLIGCIIIEVVDLIERISVGTPTGPICEPLRYTFLTPLFEGYDESGTWLSYGEEMTIPGGKYMNQETKRGCIAMCVKFMHIDDSVCLGDMVMDRMKYTMIGDMRSFKVCTEDKGGKFRDLRIERQLRTSINPVYSFPGHPEPKGKGKGKGKGEPQKSQSSVVTLAGDIKLPNLGCRHATGNGKFSTVSTKASETVVRFGETNFKEVPGISDLDKAKAQAMNLAQQYQRRQSCSLQRYFTTPVVHTQSDTPFHRITNTDPEPEAAGPPAPQAVEVDEGVLKALRAEMVFPERDEDETKLDYVKLKTPKVDEMPKDEKTAYDWTCDPEITESLKAKLAQYVPSDRNQIHRLVHTNPLVLLVPICVILITSLMVFAGIATAGGIIATFIATTQGYGETFLSMDLAKGYLQFLLSRRLREASCIGPGHNSKLSFEGMRMFLGLIWSGPWFQSNSDLDLGALTDVPITQFQKEAAQFENLGPSTGLKHFDTVLEKDDNPSPEERDHATYSELETETKTIGDRLHIEDKDLAKGRRYCFNYVDDGNWRSGSHPLRTLARWVLIILSLYSVMISASLHKFKQGTRLEMLGIEVDIGGKKNLTPEKENVIAGWEEPRKPEDLVRFLATCNFSNEFGFCLSERDMLQSAANDKSRKPWRLTKLEVEAFKRMKESFQKRVVIHTLDIPAGIAWRSSKRPVKFSVDSSRVSAGVAGMQARPIEPGSQESRGKQALFWLSQYRFTPQEQQACGNSSVRLEILGLSKLTRKVLTKIPKRLPLFIFFDNSCLSAKELHALLGLGQIQVRSILALLSEILLELNSREAYTCHKAGELLTAVDAVSRCASGDPQEEEDAKEILRKDLIELFDLAGDYTPGAGKHNIVSLQTLRRALRTLDEYASTPSICRIVLAPNSTGIYKLRIDSDTPMPPGEVFGVYNIEVKAAGILPLTDLDAVQRPDLVEGINICLLNSTASTKKITPDLLARDSLSGIRDPVVTKSLKLTDINETGKYQKAKLGTDEEQDKEIAEKTEAMQHVLSDADFHQKIADHLWATFDSFPPLLRAIMIKALLIFNIAWTPGRPFPTAIIQAYHRLRLDPGKVAQCRMFSVAPKEIKALDFLLKEAVHEGFLKKWIVANIGLPVCRACIFLAYRAMSALGRLIVDAPSLNQLYASSFWPIPPVQDVVSALMVPDSNDDVSVSKADAKLAATFLGIQIKEWVGTNVAAQQLSTALAKIMAQTVILNIRPRSTPLNALTNATRKCEASDQTPQLKAMTDEDIETTIEIGNQVGMYYPGVGRPRTKDYWEVSADGKEFKRRHIKSRKTLFTPFTRGAKGEPDARKLTNKRVSLIFYGTDPLTPVTRTDNWRKKELEHMKTPTWTGSTTFYMTEEPQEPAPAPELNIEPAPDAGERDQEPKEKPKRKPKANSKTGEGDEAVLAREEWEEHEPLEGLAEDESESEEEEPALVLPSLTEEEKTGEAVMFGEQNKQQFGQQNPNFVRPKEPANKRGEQPENQDPYPLPRHVEVEIAEVNVIAEISQIPDGTTEVKAATVKELEKHMKRITGWETTIASAHYVKVPSPERLALPAGCFAIGVFESTEVQAEGQGNPADPPPGNNEPNVKAMVPDVDLNGNQISQPPAAIPEPVPAANQNLNEPEVPEAEQGAVAESDEAPQAEGSEDWRIQWRFIGNLTATETTVTVDQRCTSGNGIWILACTDYHIIDRVADGLRSKIKAGQSEEFGHILAVLKAEDSEREEVVAKQKTVLKRAAERRLLLEQVRRGIYRLYGELIVFEVYRGQFCILAPAIRDTDGSSVVLDLVKYYHTPTGEAGIHSPASATEQAIIDAGFYSSKLKLAASNFVRWCLRCVMYMPFTSLAGPSNLGKLHSIGNTLIVDLVEGFHKEHGYDSIYTGVDAGSGFVTMEETDKGTASVWKHVRRDVIRGNYGKVQADNGPCFGDEFKQNIKNLARELKRPIEYELLKSGVSLRPESQSLGETPHSLSNRGFRCALLEIDPDTEEPPSRKDWTAGVRKGWVKRLPQVSVTVNYQYRLANKKTRAVVHHGRRTGHGNPIFHATPSNCIEVIDTMITAAAKGDNLTLLQKRSQRSREKRTESVLESVQGATELTAAPQRGEFVLRRRGDKTGKFASGFRSMLFVVHEATSIAVRAQRIDMRKEYVHSWTNITLFRRVNVTRTAVLMFLTAIGAPEKIWILDQFARYGHEVELSPLQRMSPPTLGYRTSAAVGPDDRYQLHGDFKVLILNIGGRSLVTRMACAFESQLLRWMMEAHDVVFMSETKVSAKTKKRALELLQMLVQGTNFRVVSLENESNSGSDGVVLLARCWVLPRFEKVNLNLPTDSEGRYIALSFGHPQLRDLGKFLFVYSPNCGRQFAKEERRILFEGMIRLAATQGLIQWVLGDLNCLFDRDSPDEVRPGSEMGYPSLSVFECEQMHALIKAMGENARRIKPKMGSTWCEYRPSKYSFIAGKDAYVLDHVISSHKGVHEPTLMIHRIFRVDHQALSLHIPVEADW